MVDRRSSVAFQGAVLLFIALVLSPVAAAAAGGLLRDAPASQTFTCCDGQPSCGSVFNDLAACSALGDLYYSTGGPSWVVNGGWSAAAQGIPTDYCQFNSSTVTVAQSLMGYRYLNGMTANGLVSNVCPEGSTTVAVL
jgi:hypothetical protein